MTLGRYILLLGSDATSQGGACIDHIAERTDLHLVTKGDGFAILGTARDMVLPLPGSGGALIGTLFARHGPSRRILPQDDKWLEELAPFDPSPQRYHHNRTGEDNADAHHKRQIMGREVVVAITNGRLHLGPWEHIFYYEFDGRRKKRILVKILGE